MTFKPYQNEKALIINQSHVASVVHINSVVGNEEIIIDKIQKDTLYVYINGGVSLTFLKHLIQKRHDLKPFSLIVNDASQFIVDPGDLLVLKQLNVKVHVLHEINICALSYNPISPFGYQFDNLEFYEKLSELIHIPIINVLTDKEVT